MIVVNTETLPGYRIRDVKGLVQGNTVRSKNVGRDLMAAFKNIVGGELKGYTEMMVEARQQAMDRMVDQAEELGANAILSVRYTTAAITQGAAELLTYGTAVLVESTE